MLADPRMRQDFLRIGPTLCVYGPVYELSDRTLDRREPLVTF